MNGTPETALFFGRLHPLLVHLPIAFILLLAFLELLARLPRFKQANHNVGIILALAVPAALVSALCGWLLSLGGGYEDRLLQWHKWTGIGTAAICLLAGLLYSVGLRKLYRGCLLFGVLTLAVASHLGGSLTHGSDYLVRYAPGWARRWLGSPASAPATNVRQVTAAEAQLFADIVHPILQKNCIGCHGPDKSKAGLRLDSLEGMLHGGEKGPALLPGKSAESLMLQRVLLPSAHDDHMPPEGKPQPNSADIALLQWWIDTGATTNKTVNALNPPAPIARILETRFGGSAQVAKTINPKPFSEISPSVAQLSADLNIPLAPISAGESWLLCNASLAGTNFGDPELARLAPFAANLRWLDLGGTSITDTGLTQVAAMANLTRLHLERTSITDAGLGHVAGLANLEYLNLYATAITDAGLESLRTLPKLKQLYIWESKVSPEGAKAFAEARTDKDQLERWQQEIEQIRTKIREARFVIDTGLQPSAQAATNTTASVNTECPVSGKPVDPMKTVTHDGKLIAFCCDDCKAKFEKDPKSFLEKLLMPKESKNETTK